MAKPPDLRLLEDIAESNNQAVGFTPRLIACRANALKRAIRAGGVALDLGCADGILTRALAEHHDRVVAVDASSIRAQRTRQATQGLAVDVRESLFEQFEPYDGERFDAIILSCILEHLDDPVLLLKRCRSWLTKSGVVAAVVPHKYSIHRRIGVQMGLLADLDALGESDDALDHKRIYSLELLKSDFERASLSVDHTGGILFKPLPNSMMAELAPALVDAFESVGNDLPHQAAEIYAVGRLKL